MFKFLYYCKAEMFTDLSKNKIGQMTCKKNMLSSVMYKITNTTDVIMLLHHVQAPLNLV